METNKTKTIIYIGGFELPDKNAAAQRVIANGKIFRDLGYDVVFLGVSKSLNVGLSIENTRKKCNGFEVWEAPYPNDNLSWLKYITSCAALTTLIEKIYKNRLYAVICYNYPFVAQLRIKYLCKKIGALYIPDATEWYGSGGGGLMFNVIKWLDTTLRMRFLHPKADGIIATSKYLSEYYINKNCQVVEIPTLFDTVNLDQTHSPVTEKEKGVKYLMYAGSPFDVKRARNDRRNIKDRLDLIVNLLHQLYEANTKFVLTVYGLTREDYIAVFPEHASILAKMRSCIIFCGRRKHSEIIANVKSSDFTIFMREVDRVTESGFPSKFSESISCGTPVITNMISNIEKYIIDGRNGFVIDLHDSDKQVEKMMKVLSMREEDVATMKAYCLDSNLLDYRKYLAPVRTFMNDIRVDR